MAHNDRDRNRTGPLSLQVGQVTSAVDDLITGYEHIVDSLPQVASKVSEMHHGTTALAEELEVRESMPQRKEEHSYLLLQNPLYS